MECDRGVLHLVEPAATMEELDSDVSAKMDLIEMNAV
jgi:hypothetical protein